MKLYKSESNYVADIRSTPFEGAEEIEVFPWQELVDQFQAWSDANNKGWYADGVFEELAQNDDGPEIAPGSEFSETIFSPPYCSPLEEDIRAAFFGDRLYAYDPLIWEEEDGEMEWDIDNDKPYWYRVW